MPVVVPIKFPFASKDLWFDPSGLDIVEADYAICSTERGTEFGLVTADPFEVSRSQLSCALKPVLRIADDDDLDRADELAARGETAMEDFRSLIKRNGLDMKPVGVEYLFGGEKTVFYFAAEDRVDFRQLIRDLASRFHERVDMRQIGVRDETRLIGGYAQCGQELCCARFGRQFEPVSIRMAKEQDLPLNSAKISGVCGRLMCCLRYEFEAYKDFKGRAPKKKTLIDTPLGKARIQEYDTPKEQLVLRLESGRVFRVDLSDMSCSEACVKRSEQIGCACRPDCVGRDVLERIESPEISLALLELDREMGIDVGDGLDSRDRIEMRPASGRGRRRRSAAGSGDAARSDRSGAEHPRRRGAESAEQPASRPTAGRKRRRRSGSSGEPKDGAIRGDRAEEPRESGSDAGANRRRRRHSAADKRGEAGEASSSRVAGEAGAHRRHRAEGRNRPATPSVADQIADGSVSVRRRRPGDQGGSEPGVESAPTDAKPEQRRRRRRAHKPRRAEGGEAGGRSGAAPSASK